MLGPLLPLPRQGCVWYPRCTRPQVQQESINDNTETTGGRPEAPRHRPQHSLCTVTPLPTPMHDSTHTGSRTTLCSVMTCHGARAAKLMLSGTRRMTTEETQQHGQLQTPSNGWHIRPMQHYSAPKTKELSSSTAKRQAEGRQSETVPSWMIPALKRSGKGKTVEREKGFVVAGS